MTYLDALTQSLWKAFVFLVVGLAPYAIAIEVRVKDFTTLEGVRSNGIEGLGLVVGLNKTGGKSPVTRQLITNMLDRYGVRSDPLLRSIVRLDTQTKTDSLSAVIVRADLPVFRKPGQMIDVTVGAIDGAKSLQGGMLLRTPLMGSDGQVYAVAEGLVKIGGFSFSGDAATVEKNHPTTGRITDGAVVEKQIPNKFGLCSRLRLLLQDEDFTTAQRVADTVNHVYPGVAHAQDKGTVALDIPKRYRGRVSEFVASVENLTFLPDVVARVVINERTGTVVIGANVKLSQAAVTHANLAVVTTESPVVSQPAPLSNGETVVAPRTSIDVTEEAKPLQVLRDSSTVGDLANALNALGATPRDLATIFQMLKSAGALHAHLEFQ